MSLSDDLVAAARAGVDEALLAAARQIAEQAKRNMPVGDPELDPDREVNLRDSVHIDAHPGGVKISVDAPHAAKQEFDLRLHHPRGGGPRYLGRAVQQVAPRLDGLVAAQVQGRMARGVRKQAWRGS